MDLTKLFLGDVLEGMDLGGLSKLGFSVSDDFEHAQSADASDDDDDEEEEEKISSLSNQD